MEIRVDDLSGAQVQALLAEHLRAMNAVSPPESVHALDLSGLRRPEVIFWSIWSGPDLAGCGALKQLDGAHAEVKSMRTSDAFRRRGVATRMLAHLIEEAQRRLPAPQPGDRINGLLRAGAQALCAVWFCRVRAVRRLRRRPEQRLHDARAVMRGASL